MTELLQPKFINSVSFNTEHFAKGSYLYELRDKNGVIKKGNGHPSLTTTLKLRCLKKATDDKW